MKKILLNIGLIIIFIGFIITIVINKTDKQTIKVAEVTHSVFYAPWYVALENGYFAEQGLDIEVILTPGADKVSAAVLSGDVQIGFAGPESAIYVYNGGEDDYLKVFSGLTKRDGQFIVSRKKEDNFKLSDLKNKEILDGRLGGMPALNFLNAIYKEDIDDSNINFNYSIEFAALSGSFISGVGDYVNLFEPNATKLEKEGYGYIVGSIGLLSGEVPYTAYCAKKSYIDNNSSTIIRFTTAINKGLEFVKNNNSMEIAKVILSQFPDSSLNDIEKMISRYKDADSWLDNPYISEESFNNLQDIMIRSELINEYVPYDDLVNNVKYE